ncbi:MAG: class I SAM-dependent methyltransferase [Blastocatellia bacterium]|nr:class I SAM-dependent methyltransferase [Blastocatellia bacterium]
MANLVAYDEAMTEDYVDGAPHIKHASLRTLYSELVLDVFEFARSTTEVPSVLDLGAGEGSVTVPFLELGAEVVAVDISHSQLALLKLRCEKYSERLRVREEDINETLSTVDEDFDVIVVNSFLHHVPDYLGMIQEAVQRLKPGGQFFSFHDPLRYDSLTPTTRAFTSAAYFSWRVFKGDVFGGLLRRLRRARGIYIEDSKFDNAEYHVTRNGVDQEAICKFFDEAGFEYRLITYFSSQSSLFQPLGEKLNMHNSFGIIARNGSAKSRS